MNQYKEKTKVAALLRDTAGDDSGVKIANGMVEMHINGERAVVPTMEAFARLTAKVAALEQRINSMENKINQVRARRPE